MPRTGCPVERWAQGCAKAAQWRGGHEDVERLPSGEGGHEGVERRAELVTFHPPTAGVTVPYVLRKSQELTRLESEELPTLT